eukprot:scaffold605372_cov34-Prasinocladus_malaysianus.AAC.2
MGNHGVDNELACNQSAATPSAASAAPILFPSPCAYLDRTRSTAWTTCCLSIPAGSPVQFPAA